ncbi:MAG TPA: hypothetical protein VNA89_06455 [Gemmatimonadaceae bacterium]|nr:hypothetical protein [Gemmatimonadaceae bacterium]
MPRVLTMMRTIVPPHERKKYTDRNRRKRDYYAKHKCRFWVFEEVGLPGAFLEFFEAENADVLTAAHAGAPEPIVDPARVYREVEF